MATITNKFLLVTVTDTSTNPPTVSAKMIPVPLNAVCADVPILWAGSPANIAALIDRSGPPAGKQEDVLVCVVTSNDTYVDASNSDYTPVGGGNPTPGPDPVDDADQFIITGTYTAP